MSMQPIRAYCMKCGNSIPFGNLLCADCFMEKMKLDLDWLLDL